jgi:hypothetical protein
MVIFKSPLEPSPIRDVEVLLMHRTLLGEPKLGDSRGAAFFGEMAGILEILWRYWIIHRKY